MRRATLVLISSVLLFLPFVQPVAFSSDHGLRLKSVSPIPGADWVPLESGITLHFDRPVSVADTRVQLQGEKGGLYAARLEATSDPTVLVVKPSGRFLLDETVTVQLDGSDYFQESWSFQTVKSPVRERTIHWLNQNAFEDFGYEFREVSARSAGGHVVDETDEAELPLTMPSLNVENTGGAADGLIFLQAFDHGASREVQCNLVLNNAGDIIYYEYFNDRIPFDWQPHDNVGKVSYFRYSDRHFYIMDTTWTYVDYLTSANGYRADPHELRLLEDGSYYLLAYDIRVMDLSEIIESGDEEAVVTGSVVQHIDADGNVLFEWRSLDHFALTDVDTMKVDLTESSIDACHSNSIDFDHDGNLIVSNRNLSEITKLNRDTGEIMWRFSGSQNQFTFLGDEQYPGCGVQHDAGILENGNLLLFNNGAHQSNNISSAKEYALDTEAMTAELVWSYQNELETISWAMGSARRQPNGNTLIGWGTARAFDTSNPIATEVDQAGNVVWRLWYEGGVDDNMISYRAYRSSMTFQAARPSLAAVWNGQEVELYLNYFGHDDVASFRTVYRVSGSADSTRFESDEGRVTLDGLESFEEYEFYTIALDEEGNESFPSALYTLHENQTSVDDPSVVAQPTAIAIESAWPNPFNASTTVAFDIARRTDLRASLVNVLGREVAVLHQGTLNPGQHQLSIQGESLASGIYFVRLEADGTSVQSKRIVCLK